MKWCLERHIPTTRSRPYHKNDNANEVGDCYAEQKNYDAVRKTVGYFRFDTPEEHAALAEVYRFLCPLYNYWLPSFRLLDKVQLPNGRYRKVYEKAPATPRERLLASPDVPEESKAELRRRKTSYNPEALNAGLNAAVERLLRIHREKVYPGNGKIRGSRRGGCGMISAGFWFLGNHPFSTGLFIRHCGLYTFLYNYAMLTLLFCILIPVF